MNILQYRLPYVLSRLPDEELVARAKGGCSLAADHLLSKYRGLVEGKARTFFLVGAERDDVVQEGMIGLFKAIRDFKADKLAAFRSFAETCITRQIITATKMATRKKHYALNSSVSLDTSPDEGAVEPQVTDAVATRPPASPEQVVVGKVTLREIDQRMKASLSQLECIALSAYLAGQSYHDIAKRLDMSSKQIDNALQRAKRKMKRRLREVLQQREGSG